MPKRAVPASVGTAYRLLPQVLLSDHLQAAHNSFEARSIMLAVAHIASGESEHRMPHCIKLIIETHLKGSHCHAAMACTMCQLSQLLHVMMLYHTEQSSACKDNTDWGEPKLLQVVHTQNQTHRRAHATAHQLCMPCRTACRAENEPSTSTTCDDATVHGTGHESMAAHRTHHSTMLPYSQ